MLYRAVPQFPADMQLYDHAWQIYTVQVSLSKGELVEFALLGLRVHFGEICPHVKMLWGASVGLDYG